MKSITLKIILLGDTFTGKTSLMNIICKNEFSSIFTSTIGVDFKKINHITKNNNNFKCYIWDTSGQEKFDAIVSSYFRNINCACIVYDICKYESFLNVDKWIKKLKEDNLFDDLLIFVIGNKLDLNKREVPKKEAEKYCINNDYLFLEVSAKEKINTANIVKMITDKFDEKINDSKLYINYDDGKLITPLEMKNNNKYYKCCNIL